MLEGTYVSNSILMDKKLWYIYMIEYYAAERKKELLLSVTACMDLESIMLSEITQAVKTNTI